LPDQEIILELMELAEMGRMRPLHERVKHLEQSDAELQVFTGELMVLIKSLQIHKILNYLKAQMEA
jgi:hypothetical protein